MDFLNRAISRRLVFSHENAIWIDWNPRAISVTILSKTHFGFGSDLVTGNKFSIFFSFSKRSTLVNFLLADRPGHFGALVQRPELYQNSRYLYHPVTSYGHYLRPVCPSKAYFCYY